VPRNSSGTYSLYTPGNPVVTSTVISSTWANNTLADLASAITDSLSRSGDGGMQAPLELDNGAIGAPSLTWATETTSGLYRQAAGNFRFSISAADVLTLTAAAVTIAPPTVIGAATGGAQGAGTINATAVYDDGVLLTPSPVGANPTGTIGLTAVNGAAVTFLRSDGAPALDQGIVPSWTGTHTWTGAGTQKFVVNSTNANGAYTTYSRSGTALADIGNAAQVFSGGVLDNFGITTRGAQALQLGTNSAVRFTIASGGDITATGAAAFGGDVTFTVSSVAYSAGYRGAPSRTITTSDSTAALDNGRMVLFTGAGSQTFTVDSDFGAAGNIMSLLNGGTGSLAIAESLSGTLTWLNGSGSLSTGSRTLAIGGIATIWMVDANNAYIYGTGIT
jgi:hypothetical protein